MGARRLRATTWATKRGEASAAGTAGEPPALLTSTSTRPKRSVVAVQHRRRLLGVAHVGGEEHRPPSARRGQLVEHRLRAPADGHVRPGGQERLGDAPTHAPRPAGDDDHLVPRSRCPAPRRQNLAKRPGREGRLDASKGQQGDSQEG